MAVVPGEYEFTCGECNGDGQIEVGDRDYGDHEWVTCEDCHGAGIRIVDDQEAAEIIQWSGAVPLRAPAGFSED